MSAKVLFILKRREDFSAEKHSAIGMSTGLYNSANFMHQMLLANGIESNMEVVIDNNCIDRVVTQHRPTHVIIEAIWVVPPKFDILQKLHPKVKWIIRVHSEMPFMAGEGPAMDWLADYTDFENLVIAMNAPRMMREISFYLKHRNKWNNATLNKRVIYLPNFYPQDYEQKIDKPESEFIDISCFGAIRPLKNHLLQAFAAVEFAEQIGKRLRFHVNAGRIEMQGGPVERNLKGLFQQIHGGGHQMINNAWRPREEFLELTKQMDIALQCNFSETFNIVGADHVSVGVPLISNAREIPWSVPEFCADPADSADIIRALHHTLANRDRNVDEHQARLTKYTDESARIWCDYFGKA
jgi:hypothetical protein